jgi:hypothetical protein
VGYCYPSGIEKTIYKWDIYVPLVTKGLIEIYHSKLWLFLHFILEVHVRTEMMDALNTHNCLGLIQVSISFSQLISRLA